jgi:hypothetical protein
MSRLNKTGKSLPSIPEDGVLPSQNVQLSDPQQLLEGLNALPTSPVCKDRGDEEEEDEEEEDEYDEEEDEYEEDDEDEEEDDEDEEEDDEDEEEDELLALPTAPVCGQGTGVGLPEDFGNVLAAARAVCGGGTWILPSSLRGDGRKMDKPLVDSVWGVCVDHERTTGAAKEVMDLLVEKGKLIEDTGSYFSHGYKETQHHSRRPSSGRGETLAGGRSGSSFGSGVAVYRLRTDETWGGDTPTSQIPCDPPQHWLTKKGFEIRVSEGVVCVIIPPSMARLSKSIRSYGFSKMRGPLTVGMEFSVPYLGGIRVSWKPRGAPLGVRREAQQVIEALITYKKRLDRDPVWKMGTAVLEMLEGGSVSCSSIGNFLKRRFFKEFKKGVTTRNVLAHLVDMGDVVVNHTRVCVRKLDDDDRQGL